MQRNTYFDYSPPLILPNIKGHIDYYPFGSAINTRSYSSGAYRYGFNGKEKDTESFNDAYDFGARIYDARLGRFLLVDPKSASMAFSSTFSYANNSPIIYIDFLGESPKVAIIMTHEGIYEFDDHYKALKAQGYLVIRVTNGKELLKAMKDNSTASDPIKDLVVYSHAWEGGLMGTGENTGLFKDRSELESQTSVEIENEKYKYYFSGVETDPSAPGYDPKIEAQADADFNAYLASPQFQTDVNDRVNEHLAKTTILVEDVFNADLNAEIHFDKNARIGLGGCNSAGYDPIDPITGEAKANNGTLASDLSVSLNIPVTGATGLSSPVTGSTTRSADNWITYNGSNAPVVHNSNKYSLGTNKPMP